MFAGLIEFLDDEFNVNLGLQPYTSLEYRNGIGGKLDLTRLVVYQKSMTIGEWYILEQTRQSLS